MSDVSLKDAAVAELKLVTTGWLKVNGQPRYPNGPGVTTHWNKAMTLLSQISVTNATPRNAAVAALKKTTKGYSANGVNWKTAMTELAKIVDVAPPTPTYVTNVQTGQALTAPFTWTATVSPAPDKVEFWATRTGGGADVLLKTDAAAPHDVILTLADGSYILGICAWHGAVRTCFEDRRTVSIAGVPPPLKIIYPSNTLYPAEVSP